MTAPVQRPNILFVLADDWGYGDLGCQGHPELQTPHLDRLAAGGTRFTEFHVTSPVCSPSRCSVITGHYPARHLLHGHLARYDLNAKRHMPHWLDVNVHSLPRLMQQAGYRTAHYGKWHLGGGGGINGHPDAPAVKAYGYDDTRTWNGNGPTWYGKDKWPFTLENDPDIVWSAHCCGSAVDETIAFIRNGADAKDVDLSKPFFINLWIKDPHTPLNPTAEQRQPYAHLPEPQQTYYSVLTNADRQIGRLLQFLDESGLSENTLVIFSSDNGPEWISKEWGTCGSTGGLRGRKRSLFEGGIRTPFIVRWPGKTPAGQVDNTSLISAVDLLPTFLALAGAKLPEDLRPDGVDVTAALTGKPFARPCPLMWEWRDRNPHDEEYWPMLGIREGEYQLLVDPGTPATPPRAELYHVPSDPFQQKDIAAQHPERVARLQRQLEDWNRALPGYPTRFGAKLEKGRQT